MNRITAGFTAVALLTITPRSADTKPRTDVYLRHNLVSDLPDFADHLDPNLVNPWGIAYGPTSPFWIADNGTGVSTLYDGTGTPFPAANPLIVTVLSRMPGNVASGMCSTSYLMCS